MIVAVPDTATLLRSGGKMRGNLLVRSRVSGRHCGGAEAVTGDECCGLDILGMCGGTTSRQMLDYRCAAYFDVYQTRTTAARTTLAHGSRSELQRIDRSYRFRGRSFLVGIGERKSPAHVSGGA